MKSDLTPLVAERAKADVVTGGRLPFAQNSSSGMTVAASDEKSIGSAEPIGPTIIVFRSKRKRMPKTKRAAAAAAQHIHLRAQLPYSFRSWIILRVSAIALPPNRSYCPSTIPPLE